MPWHAQRLMNINGKLYDTGDEIPAEEVESWRNLSAYMRHGWVAGTSEARMAMAERPAVRSEHPDPATDGARQTFPREWPAADKPPTAEPVGNAAAGTRANGPAATVEAVPAAAGKVTTVSEPRKPEAAKPAPPKRS